MTKADNAFEVLLQELGDLSRMSPHHAFVCGYVAAANERDAVMRRVLDLLGPDVPECSGCAAEWRMAIDEINEVL
jgi:hypothetical protein